MQMLVSGKRIIVIGGASGIGEASIKAFAREGAAVVSLDISDEAGEAVASDAARLGPGPIIYRRLDVTRRHDVEAMFAEAAQLLGGIDTLAMIAGIAAVQRQAEDYTADEFDGQYAMNCRGTILANQAAFRHMRGSGGGSIINYTSAAGVAGMARNAAYGTSKAAILGWTRNAAIEWGRHLVRVNAVCPLVMTPMAKAWLDSMDMESRRKIDAFYESKVVLGGKMGEVDDAANVNLFLASDLSRFVTGALIAVDGGMTMPR